jgi:Ala-tRNA(Pro) deacylase
MSISITLKEYLDNNNVDYEITKHKVVYTSQELAACLHVPGKVMTKVVMVKAGGKDVMTVMPACRKVDVQRLKGILKLDDVRIEKEEEFMGLFPKCDVGAIPPFGNLFGLTVYMDSSLTDDEYLLIQTGSNKEALRIKYKDFARLVNPKVYAFTLIAA